MTVQNCNFPQPKRNALAPTPFWIFWNNGVIWFHHTVWFWTPSQSLASWSAWPSSPFFSTIFFVDYFFVSNPVSDNLVQTPTVSISRDEDHTRKKQHRNEPTVSSFTLSPYGPKAATPGWPGGTQSPTFDFDVMPARTKFRFLPSSVIEPASWRCKKTWNLSHSHFIGCVFFHVVEPPTKLLTIIDAGSNCEFPQPKLNALALTLFLDFRKNIMSWLQIFFWLSKQDSPKCYDSKERGKFGLGFDWLDPIRKFDYLTFPTSLPPNSCPLSVIGCPHSWMTGLDRPGWFLQRGSSCVSRLLQRFQTLIPVATWRHHRPTDLRLGFWARTPRPVFDLSVRVCL